MVNDGLVPIDDITLRVLQREAHRASRENGWYDNGPRSIGDVLTAVHSEISEAWVDYRNARDLCRTYYEGNKPCGFGIECVDAILIISDLNEYLGNDLTHLAHLKMEYNATRGHRHGGKLG